MKDTEILLTLAISTFYERGEILNNTLSKITSDPAFDERVEIVIIDNGSADRTEEICRSYEKQFQNVIYYKNKENIGNKNFSKVLCLGKGIYLKFLNDTQYFNPGKLAKVLSIIEKHKDDAVNVLFCKRINHMRSHKKEIIVCDGKHDILHNLSFYTTWSGNFGAFNCYFKPLENKNRMADMKFPQVDWIYRLSEQRKTLLYIDDFYIVTPTLRKGTWNFFEVFTNYYFEVLLSFFKSGISMEREKYYIFRNFILPFYYTLSVEKTAFRYNMSNSNKILLKHYWYYPYTYLWIIAYCGYKKVGTFVNIFKR